MVQVFFGKTQMNGLLQQKFQKLTPIMILKPKRWQLSIWLAKNKIFCQFKSRVSRWVKMKRVLALVMLFKSKLLSKISDRKTYLDSKNNNLIDVQMMEETKMFIIKIIEKRSFGTEVKTMRSNGKNQYIKRESPLYRLDQFIAEDGIIRVGGRPKIYIQ